MPYLLALAVLLATGWFAIQWTPAWPLAVAGWVVFVYSGWRSIYHNNEPLTIGRRQK
jgi:hypothetical protein